MIDRFFPAATMRRNSSSNSGASLSLTKRCGQYATDLVPMRMLLRCGKCSSGSM
ncbi:hypothetical protein D9M71_817720 [compost metagenome]